MDDYYCGRCRRNHRAGSKIGETHRAYECDPPKPVGISVQRGIDIQFCPRCGRPYDEVPATSRRDDKTKICPKCGVEEAVVDWAISQGGDKEGAPFIAALITDMEFTRTLLRAATEQKA